jgi:hypothetical protein
MSRACQVTFVALDGLRHVAEIQADSVYEAAVLAIRAFRKAGFMDLQPGTASKLSVQVREPTVTHEVTVAQVKRWLDLASSNPNEVERKRRLKELMAAVK